MVQDLLYFSPAYWSRFTTHWLFRYFLSRSLHASGPAVYQNCCASCCRCFWPPHPHPTTHTHRGLHIPLLCHTQLQYLKTQERVKRFDKHWQTSHHPWKYFHLSWLTIFRTQRGKFTYIGNIWIISHEMTKPFTDSFCDHFMMKFPW